MTEFEKNAYGMSADHIRKQYMEGLVVQTAGLEMVVMSILSDVQELNGAEFSATSIANAKANKKYISQQLNIAKFILCEMMDQKEAAQ